MWFWLHDYFACKNHISPIWVDVKYLCCAGEYTTSTRLSNVRSTGWDTQQDIFLAGQKQYWWWECFPIHEIGRIDGGRGIRTGGNVFRIGRNTCYNQENKIPMKITEFKRSGIGLIAEFRWIPNGFPNQEMHCHKTKPPFLRPANPTKHQPPRPQLWCCGWVNARV
jgi:hypothetical protein